MILKPLRSLLLILFPGDTTLSKLLRPFQTPTSHPSPRVESDIRRASDVDGRTYGLCGPDGGVETVGEIGVENVLACEEDVLQVPRSVGKGLRLQHTIAFESSTLSPARHRRKRTFANFSRVLLSNPRSTCAASSSTPA